MAKKLDYNRWSNRRSHCQTEQAFPKSEDKVQSFQYREPHARINRKNWLINMYMKMEMNAALVARCLGNGITAEMVRAEVNRNANYPPYAWRQFYLDWKAKFD